MKYTTLINTAGVCSIGMENSTDANDWMIIDYIKDWFSNPKATFCNGHVWINYKHILSELPLLPLRSKSAVSSRISKLESLGLITVTYDSNGRLFAKLTALSHEACTFSGVQQTERGVQQTERGVQQTERGVQNSVHTTTLPISNHQESSNHNHSGRDPLRSDGAEERRQAAEEVVAIYHEVLPELPSIAKLTDSRIKAINARIKDDMKSPEDWRRFFSKVAESDFLTGRSEKFQANLDWLVKPTNLLKVLEGNYKNRASARQSAYRDPLQPETIEEFNRKIEAQTKRIHESGILDMLFVEDEESQPANQQPDDWIWD